MAFAVVVPAKSSAARALHALQPPLRAAFWHHLRKLEPASDSSPVFFADPVSRGQAYQFKIQLEDQAAYFTVVFRFADVPDENTLIVGGIDVTIV